MKPSSRPEPGIAPRTDSRIEPVLRVVRSLGIPGDLPLSLKIAIFWYLSHVLFQGKVALLESTAFFASLFLGWAIGKRFVRPSFHILYFPLLLYGVISTTSWLFADRKLHILGDGMLWLKMLIFPTALILFRTVPRVRDLALAGQIIFGVYIATYGLVQYFALDHRELESRITGSSTHVMTYSGLLLPIALLLVVMWLHAKRWWMLASASMLSLALLLTFTRSIWIGWMAAVIAIITMYRPRWFAWAAPALLIFVTLMPLPLFSRLMSTFDVQQSSNLDRIRMAEAGLEMIQDHPVLGVGPANVKELYPLYRRHDAPRFRPPHLHNNLIQLWAERGVIALAAYLMLMGLFLQHCFRSRKTEARPFAIAGIAVTVGLGAAGLFEFNFGDTEVFYLMLELFALVIAFTESRVGVDRWLENMAEVGANWRSNSPSAPVVRTESGLSPSP
jgi:putative inorganic carbon (HCO3(-)) transporter